MKRSICTILMVALLVLPAGSLGVAQESPPQPEAAAPGWGLAAEPAAMDRGEVDEYEPWVPPVRAGPGAVITVTTTDDELNSDGDCALREAIQAANTDAAVDACVAGSGDDTVVVPSGTYTLTIPGAYEDNNQTGDLDILDNLVIQGDGAETTIIDGGGLDRILDVHPGRMVEINDLTVTHGSVSSEGGGGIRNRGTLNLNQCTVRENGATDALGGGIWNATFESNSTLTLDYSLVISNTVTDGDGGGISNDASPGLTAELTLNHSHVISNTASDTSGGYGGAAGIRNAYRVYGDGVARATLNDSTVRGNQALWGGGIGTGSVGSVDPALMVVTLNGSTVSDNVATDYDGGGIWVKAATAVLVDSTLSGNHAGYGGGGMASYAIGQDASATLINCLVIDNIAYGGGGLVSAADSDVTSTLTLSNTTVSSNTAEWVGGGIWSTYYTGATDPVSILTLNGSTVSNNTADGSGQFGGDGGGLAVVDSTATLVNSTVSGNQAIGTGLPDVSGLGGGIIVGAFESSATVALTNTSVVSNTSNVAGGGIANVNYGADTVTTFKNSLVGGNSAPAGMGESCFNPDVGFGQGTLTSVGHNLEDYDTCEFDQASDWINTDPLLGPLQDNGGPTWTHALLEGSLARDHGDDAACPSTDQRGVPRPQGPHCDIGSFEAYPDENPPAVMAVSPPDGATDVALDATVVLTFSEPISVPTFAYSVTPDPGGWAESWGPNDTVVSLTHDDFAYDTAYTATITAAEDRAGNPLAASYAWSFSTVAEPCDPVETVTVEGPASLRVGETGVYSATYAPITATLPVTLTWEDGTVGATAAYSWTLPGTYTLTVTATNPCGEAVGRFPVEVSEEAIYWIFLPLVVKELP